MALGSLRPHPFPVTCYFVCELRGHELGDAPDFGFERVEKGQVDATRLSRSPCSGHPPTPTQNCWPGMLASSPASSSGTLPAVFLAPLVRPSAIFPFHGRSLEFLLRLAGADSILLPIPWSSCDYILLTEKHGALVLGVSGFPAPSPEPKLRINEVEGKFSAFTA